MTTPEPEQLLLAWERASKLEPWEAYNFFASTSALMLDCCGNQSEDDKADPEKYLELDGLAAQMEDVCSGLLPGSAWLGTPGRQSLPTAAAAARKYVLEELTPDDASTALVLYDDVPRAQWLIKWLFDVGGCRRVLCVERHALERRHSFLLRPGSLSLRLPNEIVPNRLYLGSASSANEESLSLLGITAVLSLLDRDMGWPPSQKVTDHLLIRIADSRTANLGGALSEALPFISRVLSGPTGKVLVHCEAGASRSASVVIAALIAFPELTGGKATLSLDDALGFVRAQRPCVRPNDGFMATLYARERGAE